MRAEKQKLPIFLIYPPFTDPVMSYSSLAALAGFLRSHCFTVIQEDSNIGFFDYLLSQSGLSSVVFKLLKDKLKNKSEGPLYLALIKKIIENYDQAKGVLRDDVSFYDPVRNLSSWKVIVDLLDVLSYIYHPSKFNYWGTLDTRYSTENSQEIMQATTNNEENAFIPFFQETVIPRIAESKANLVGISITYEYQLIPGLTLARLIKASGLNVHITMGGAYISYISDYFSPNLPFFKFVNSFIVNEGEHALLELKRKLDCGDLDFSNVPNISYVSGEQMIEGPRLVENLDELTTPDYDGLPMRLYFSGEPIYMIETSRGCPHQCAFCATSPQFKKLEYRERSISLVLQDLQNIARKNNRDITYIYFADDWLRAERLRELSELLVKTNTRNIRWSGESRFTKEFTRELCELMYQAGCRDLSFGLESANQRVLNMMNKKIKVEDISPTLLNATSAGIATNCQFFFGFPTESEAEANETIGFLITNKAIITSYGFGVFSLLKGSPIYMEPDKYGIRLIKDPNKDLQVSFDYEVIKGISPQKAMEIYKMALDKLHKEWMGNSEWLMWGGDPHTFLFISKYGINFLDYLKTLQLKDKNLGDQ